METRQFHPTGDRILVERDKHIRQVGLIHLVGGKQLDICVSKVIARGPDVKAKPWDLAVGDYVLHARVSGVKYDGGLGRYDNDGDLLFLHEAECIATVDPSSIITGGAQYDQGGIGIRDLSTL